VHLINYDAQSGPVQGEIEVKLAIPGGKTIKQVLLLSPDEKGHYS
jgi:hypothetical protein